MSDKENSTLILITGSYPYGAVAESFLDTELPYLSSAFDKVVIIPRSLPSKIERIDRNLPKNVQINTSLLLKNETSTDIISSYFHAILSAVTSRYFYAEIYKNPWTIGNLTAFKRVVGYLSGALKTRDWVLEYAQQNSTVLSNTVFYTYWLDSATTGVGIAKKEYTEINLVSRAHGGDLYEERHDPPYFPYRYETLSLLNRLYLISEHGCNYLTKRYPKFQGKFELARLGVEEPGFSTKSSSDGIFRIVSCSYIVPVKRIDLLIYGLKELCQKHPKELFEWVHIGYGSIEEQIKEIAKNNLPTNISSIFLGSIPNADVISFYQNNQVDAFINVSASEGIPVSIMEAQSCGIPVIGTAVGGTPEIISKDVGILLSENPTPQEIADAIWELKNDSGRLDILRENSKSNWDEKYNAKRNYQLFSSKLKKI